MKINKVAIVASFLFLSLSATAYAASNPKATGDIVGRDLDSWAGPLGHVGIWDGGKVLEVLNKREVIQKNSFSSFKESSKKYWGARYGKGKRHYKVIRSGWNQRKYSPAYTYAAQYREGGWKKEWRWNSRYRKWTKKWVKKTAKFRCDSFVRYSYIKGAGEDLAWNGEVVTPSIIYNSMPKSR